MARLSLSVLGPLQVSLDGQRVTGFESNKARALLVYLAVEADRPHGRDVLAGLLWPDQPDQAAHDNLRQVLANLRHAIGDRTAQPPFLHITRESLQFNAASDHQLDVVTFTTLLAACDQHVHRRPETCQSCAQRRQQAVDLYRGNFLEQFFLSDSAAFEEWAVVKREGLHRLALDALYRLAGDYERRGEYEQALRYSSRQLELDPWREEAHRQVMRALAFSGQRSAALAQYETCRRILADELGVEPTEETTALYERIRAAEPGAAFVVKPGGSAVSNLPAPLTPFVGREAELAQISGLLENPVCRLITIVGPGGIGKTRLALKVATDQLGAFVDGVCFVPLASLSSIEFMVPAIASALDYTFSGPEDPKAQLLSYLADKDMLLVLDNFEHLLDGAILLVDILQHSRQVVLLVTSRERLNVQAEWVYDLHGLRVPEADSVNTIKGYSAIELFVQRAGMARVGFALSAPEIPPVVRICRLTEGMPLGIELAAAWVRTLSCDQIAQEIERSLGILATMLRDVPERHRSIWAVFDHSWNLLTQEERRVFRQLAVFRGGFQPEAAEQVAGATLTLLTTLVDQSLLRRDAAGRYDLHELLRQYAGEKLHEAGESEQTRKRHLEFFLTLAETTEPKLKGEQQVAWLDRLEQEHDNMRSALGWAVEHDAAEHAARFAAAMHPFWERRGHLHEGRHWLEVALTHRDILSTRTRARALNGAGLLAFAQGDQVQAQTRYEESLTLFRTLGDHPGIANTLYRLGSVLKWRGEYLQAQALLQESLSVFRTLGDAWGVANTLTMLGIMAGEQGDIETGLALYRESMALRRELGDQWGIAIGLNNLANILYEQGSLKQAQALHEEALALFRELGDKDSIAMSLLNLGTVMNRQGDTVRAAAILKESLLARQSLGNKRGIAYCLEGLAEVASAQGHAQRAVRLCAAVEVLRSSIGAPWPPSERSRYSDTITGAQAQLDAANFAAAWAEGRAMTLEQAIAYALAAYADPSTV